ncbi:MAG: S9 family peptidase [Planctomycetota bacterium]|nr:S9 family peptidase [Planctomycetota bacterium]
MPRKRRIRAEDFREWRLASDPAPSPDGSCFVFALQRTNAAENRYESNLYRVPARGGPARRLTHGVHKDTQPAWSPDGQWIAFVSNREKETPQLWLLPADGGEARRLTNLAGGGVRDVRWAPDGKRVLFAHRPQPKEDPEARKKRATFKHITRLRYRLDGDGYFPAERWHLWTARVPGGTVKQLTFGDFDDGHAAWSPDGRRIAFSSNRLPDADWHPTNSDLFVIPSAGGRPRQLTSHRGQASHPAWSRDGKRLFYLGSYAGDGEWNKKPIHVFSIPAAGGKEVNLTPKLDYWPVNGVLSDSLGGTFGAVLLPFGESGAERLLIMLNERGGCRLHSLPQAGGALRPEFAEDANVAAVAVARDGRSAAAVIARIEDCGDVYRLALDGSGGARRLTHFNRAVFGRLELSAPEETWFPNGRTRVHGWILRPPGYRPGRRYPMLLQVHGGPMAQYGYTFFHEMHVLAAQGYVVVYTNPRGSDGYGTRFRCGIDGRWGTDDFSDVMAVARAMARKPYVDSKRMGILGGSYGGFMTTWVLGHSTLFKAGVTMRQAGNRYSFFGTSDIGSSWHHDFGGYPWEKPLKFLRRSPNFYAGRIQAPLLIVHSEQDYRCPLSQAEELYVSLKAQHKTVELVQFEGESHGLSRGGKPQNRLERLRRIVDWFERYL